MTPKSPVLDEVSGIWESGSPPARLLQLHAAVKQTKRFFLQMGKSARAGCSHRLCLFCAPRPISPYQPGSITFSLQILLHLVNFVFCCAGLPPACKLQAWGAELWVLACDCSCRAQILQSCGPSTAQRWLLWDGTLAWAAGGDALARKPTSFPGGIGAPSSSAPFSSKLSKCRPFRTASVWDLQPETGTGQLGSCSHHLPPQC